MPSECASASASAVCIISSVAHGTGQHAALLEQRAEVVAVEELHHHVRDVVLEPADVGDLRDVLALQLRGGLGLAGEALDRVVVEQDVLAQHLDRDALVELEVRALGDHAHPALAEDRVDPVLARGRPGRWLTPASAGLGACSHRVKMVACPTSRLNLAHACRISPTAYAGSVLDLVDLQDVGLDRRHPPGRPS